MSDILASHYFNTQHHALKKSLVGMLWHSYRRHSALESAFCALILRLNAQAKIRTMYDALPYHCAAMTLSDLANTFANLGYNCRRMKSRLCDVDARLYPCLFIPDDDFLEAPERPLVLLEKQDEWRVFDCGQESVLTVNAHDPVTRLSGTVLKFEPLKDEDLNTSSLIRQTTGYSWFKSILMRFSSIFRQVMAAGIFLNIIALIIPLFIMVVYDRVISSGQLHTLYYLVPGVVVALGFEWLLRYVRSENLSWLATRLDNIVGNAIYAHLINLPSRLVEHAPVAAQIARMRTFEYVRDFFSGPIFLSVLEIPFICIALFIIYIVAGSLVWVPLVMATLYLALFFGMRRIIKVKLRLAARASSARQEFTLESLGKIETIRAHGMSPVWYEKFRQLTGREYHAHFVLNQYAVTTEILAHALTILSAVAILVFGTHLIWQGKMSSGALIASMMLVWRVLTPLYSMCSMIPRLEQLNQSIKQVNSLLELDTERKSAYNKGRLRHLKGVMNFHNVGFKYNENADYVFRNISFEVKRGHMLVICGSSGTGKSTLLKLVQGLYEPVEGTVRLDGFDIHQLHPEDLRNQIAYVPQKAQFFYGTIAENLRLVKPAASQEQMWEALRLADADDMVSALPQKLETLIANVRKTTLPASFEYQLNLARAYLQNSRMVLIEELPDAMLRSGVGHNLKKYIEASKGKRTLVMVTKSLHFMAMADTVVWLRKDKPALIGSPLDVMKQYRIEEQGDAAQTARR